MSPSPSPTATPGPSTGQQPVITTRGVTCAVEECKWTRLQKSCTRAMCANHSQARGGCLANHVVQGHPKGTLTSRDALLSQPAPSYASSTASLACPPLEPGTGGAFGILQPSAGPSSIPQLTTGDELLPSNRNITPNATQGPSQSLAIAHLSSTTQPITRFVSHMSQPFTEQYAREENRREDKRRLDEERIHNKRRTDQSVLVYAYTKVSFCAIISYFCLSL